MKSPLKIEHWPIDKIKPYPNNSKKHKVAWIKKSIEQFDFDQPLVVDGEGVLIKGHGRLKAMQELKIEKVPVIVRTDLTPDQVRMARLADNRTAQGGGFDSDLLGDELEDLNGLFAIDEFGFSDAFLRKLSKEELNFDFDDEIDDADDLQIEQRKFALSIVLSKKQHEKWEKYKESKGKKTDIAAFLKLLETLDA